MYYLFFGQDFYSIKKKVSAIKEKFLKSDPSAINISKLSGSELKGDDFWAPVLAAPFLATKRLIIVENLLLENKDDDFKKNLSKNLSKIPETSLVFFIEDGSPDKRGVLFKSLNKPGIAQNFELPTPNSIGKLLDQKIGESDIKISSDARNKFILYVGVDLYRAENEIIKLILYSKHENIQTIEASLIEEMIRPENNAGIFDFIDAIGSKNRQKSVSLFNKLIEAGENELYILSMIVYQFRNMMTILSYLERHAQAAEIAKAGKIHPFVVQKTIGILKKYSKEKLLENYIKLGDADFAIKTGQIEPKLCILMLISDFCTS